MNTFNPFNPITLFHKSGNQGLVGANSKPLVSSDVPDAKGKALAIGRTSSWILELNYNRATYEGQFYLEAALENQNNAYSPLSYIRLDSGILVSSTTPLDLTVNTRLLLSIAHLQGLLWIRPVAFTKGGVSSGDEFIIRTLERQA